MATVLKIALAGIGLLAIAGVLFVYAPGAKGRLERLFSIPPHQPVAFETLARTPKPNQYLVCPQGLCRETPDVPADIYAVPVAQLEQVVNGLISQLPDTQLRHSDASQRQHDFVQRTPRMRYPDLITIRYIAVTDTTSTLAIYSRSVYGRSDMGVNKARIDALLRRIKPALGG